MVIDTSAAVEIALLMALLGLIFVFWQSHRVLTYPQGNETMCRIAEAIQQGAAAFLNHEYRLISLFVTIIALAIAYFLQWQTAAAFVLGQWWRQCNNSK